MKKSLIILIILGVALIIFALCTFIVREDQQVFITQFGRPVGDPIKEAGLHFKLPVVQKVHKFDRRFLEWDGDANQITTKDKRYIFVDTYARWKIMDPLVFFQKVNDERGAQTRLDDILDSATRNSVASHDLVEIVRSIERPDITTVENVTNTTQNVLPMFSYGRAKIAENILSNAAPVLEQWGIELLDIKFKRINYEESVKQSIFDRMTSERRRIAEKYRSEGEGEASIIGGQRERDLLTIRSKAERKVEEIRGEADANATEIYASAYNQNPSSRSFFAFIKSMETYEKSLMGNDWLILSTKNDLLKYIHSSTAADPNTLIPADSMSAPNTSSTTTTAPVNTVRQLQ
ncbi:MAG: protease modulator HflC [Verrucomicrobia bacterium]|nr:protease modulator HflC [Verrucomicrobiota bacterium]MCF7708500.1 protease modulator HflC [Verrucomicrobiota bacterium]